MGGGWGKQGSGIPMSERVRVGSVAAPPAGEVCPARHCWVADAADGLGVKRPGLLVEWRRAGDRWEGRVVYAVRLRPDAWQLVEEWLPASLLTPA
ncbi:MAG TPA: hypothetical protein VFO49_18555 [Nocardioides sp.]|nr:hypothetical protein [Nocardioides sp.]